MNRALLGLTLLCSACGAPGASFALSWRLVDARNPSPEAAPSLSCAQAGVQTIRLVLRPDGGQQVSADFDCTAQDGVTQPLRAGYYTIRAEALTADGRPLSALTFEETNRQGPRDLGLIIFQIPL